MMDVELVHGAAVAATENGRPPCFRRRDRMLARFGASFRMFDSGFPEKRKNRIGFTDAIPGVEAFVKVGSEVAN